MSKPVVGVIGGMGPDATVELMRRVIAATPAADDIDHIHMLVDNNPKVPSRLKALLDGSGENPGPTLAAMARRLEGAGADFLVMPCNTAHHYYGYAHEAVEIPVWHLIELSVAKIRELHPAARRIGLLASSAIRPIGLFEPSFSAEKLELIYPEEQCQARVMEVIRAVKAGGAGPELISVYNRELQPLSAEVDLLFIGCSELSVIWSQHQQSPPVVDSLQILADEIVDFAA